MERTAAGAGVARGVVENGPPICGVVPATDGRSAPGGGALSDRFWRRWRRVAHCGRAGGAGVSAAVRARAGFSVPAIDAARAGSGKPIDVESAIADRGSGGEFRAAGLFVLQSA